MTDLPIRIRPAGSRDVSFITSSWLRSFRNSPQVSGVPNSLYYYMHHKVLDEVIPRATVLVACSEDDPDVILGWLCAEVVDTAVVLHFVYVKESFRRFGVASRLLSTFRLGMEDRPVVHTHKTNIGGKISYKKKFLFNPYVLYMKLPADWHEDQQSGVQPIYPESPARLKRAAEQNHLRR